MSISLNDPIQTALLKAKAFQYGNRETNRNPEAAKNIYQKLLKDYKKDPNVQEAYIEFCLEQTNPGSQTLNKLEKMCLNLIMNHETPSSIKKKLNIHTYHMDCIRNTQGEDFYESGLNEGYFFLDAIMRKEIQPLDILAKIRLIFGTYEKEFLKKCNNFKTVAQYANLPSHFTARALYLLIQTLCDAPENSLENQEQLMNSYIQYAEHPSAAPNDILDLSDRIIRTTDSLLMKELTTFEKYRLLFLKNLNSEEYPLQKEDFPHFLKNLKIIHLSKQATITQLIKHILNSNLENTELKKLLKSHLVNFLMNQPADLTQETIQDVLFLLAEIVDGPIENALETLLLFVTKNIDLILHCPCIKNNPELHSKILSFSSRLLFEIYLASATNPHIQNYCLNAFNEMMKALPTKRTRIGYYLDLIHFSQFRTFQMPLEVILSYMFNTDGKRHNEVKKLIIHTLMVSHVPISAFFQQATSEKDLITINNYAALCLQIAKDYLSVQDEVNAMLFMQAIPPLSSIWVEAQHHITTLNAKNRD